MKMDPNFASKARKSVTTEKSYISKIEVRQVYEIRIVVFLFDALIWTLMSLASNA